MQYRPIDSGIRVRRIVLVSLAETPFLVAGALMMALGGDALFLPGVALVALTAVAGSFFIMKGLVLRDCPVCARRLEMTLEGPYCVGCDACYTRDPAKLGR